MSVRVMTAVFDYSESRGSDRLILLVIADRSDDDGTGCYRGKESIAKMARVSRSTVTTALGRLEELGELQVDRRRGQSSEYRIVLPGVGQHLAGSENGGRPESGPPVGQTVGRGVGQTGSRDTSLNHPLIHPESSRDDFEEWWAQYPRKVDKRAARGAYTARRRQGVSQHALLAAVLHYATAMRGTDPKFVKHAKTFLNGSWEEWTAGPPTSEIPDPRRHRVFGALAALALDGGSNGAP